MLTKRTHIVPVLALALALPATALAAPHSAAQGVGSGRSPLAALAPASKATHDDPRAGLAPAAVVGLAQLRRPAERFRRLVRTVAARLEARRRAVRRDRARRAHGRRAAPVALPGGVSIATLDAIAACESGGDPTAVSPGGTYRGKYQFDQGTWESVGGHGDPAAAPEAEQDYRAALLYARDGSSPWPVCG